MSIDAFKSTLAAQVPSVFPSLSTYTRWPYRFARSVGVRFCRHLPAQGVAMCYMSVAVLYAALCNPASAAIAIIAEETEAGIVWDFSGSVSGSAGQATVSASIFGAADGYLLRYLTRGTGTPKSSITVGYGGTVYAPYYTAVDNTSWSFLAPDSLIDAPIGEPGQETIRPADNVVTMTFRSSGSASVPLTELYLYGNTQAMVLDRTMFSPGLTFDDLNMTAELDTVYQLAGGNTIQFVSAVPEAGSSLLLIIGGGAVISKRRRKTA